MDSALQAILEQLNKLKCQPRSTESWLSQNGGLPKQTDSQPRTSKKQNK
jgi:hypothetical protein